MRKLAFAAAAVALCAAPLLAQEKKTRVAVVSDDEALDRAVRDAVIAAGGKPVDVEKADATALAKDGAAAAARARELAGRSTADVLIVATREVTDKREAETGSVARVTVRIFAVSGRSGETLMNVLRASKGAGGDAERAVAKARDAALAEALEGMKLELGRVLSVRDAIAVRVEVQGFGGDQRAAHGDALDGALQDAGVTVATRNLDVAKSVYVLEGTSRAAAFDDVERAVRKALDARGLGRWLALADMNSGALVYRWKDPRHVVEVAVGGMDEETQHANGNALATALGKLASVDACDATYDATTRTLTMKVRTTERASDLDASIARAGEPLGSLRLVELTGEVLRYRIVRGVETVKVEIVGFADKELLDVAARIDEAARSVLGVTEPQRTMDARTGTVRLELHFKGRLSELDLALARSLAEHGLSSLVAAEPRAGVDLAFRVPGPSRTVVRLEHLGPSDQRGPGQRFTEVVEALEGGKVVDRKYDAAAETLELTVESPWSASEIESRIWRTVKKTPELARLGPGETNVERVGFVLLTDAAHDFGCTVVVSGLAPEAWLSDGARIVERVKTLDGASKVEANYDKNARELTIKLRFRSPAHELEDSLWKALEAEPFSRALAPDKRIGDTVRIVFLERKGDRSRLFVRIEGARGEGKAVAERFLAWLKTVGSVSEAAVHAGDPISVELWSTQTPTAFYDTVALALASNTALSGLVEGGLQGNVVVVRSNSASDPGAKPPSDVAKPGEKTDPPKTEPKPEPVVERAPARAGKLAELVAKLDPGVVFIHGQVGGSAWLGTGFVISPRGYILTNYHVAGAPRGFRQSDVHLRVKTNDGRVLEATYIDGKPDMDVALLKVPGDGFTPLPIGDSDKVRRGDGVIVIGNPDGLDHTVVTGIVSGLDRDQGRIQISAPVYHGNSGGPAFDEEGRVIGIVVAIRRSQMPIASDGKPVAEAVTGVGFIIPINHALPMLETAGATKSAGGAPAAATKICKVCGAARGDGDACASCGAK